MFEQLSLKILRQKHFLFIDNIPDSSTIVKCTCITASVELCLCPTLGANTSNQDNMEDDCKLD